MKIRIKCLNQIRIYVPHLQAGGVMLEGESEIILILLAQTKDFVLWACA